MRRDSFLVEDDGSTPHKPLVACLYCSSPVGTEHKTGCVMRRRTVVLRATVEFVAVEPEDWDVVFLEGFYKGSWCADNLPDLIDRHVGDANRPECLCPVTTITFVREATEADERASALKVAELVD